MSQQINLFNPVFLAQKKYFSAAAMAQALGLVLAGMILLYAFAVRQASGLQDLLADANRQAVQQREQLIALGKQYSDLGTSKKLEEDIVRVQAQLRKRTELLGELKANIGINAEGFSRYLAALARQTTQGVWLTGIELGGKSNDLVIKGRALQAELVPAYVRSLSRDAVFAGKAVSALQVTAKEEPKRPPASSGEPAGINAPPPRYLEFTLNIPLSESGAARLSGRNAGRLS